MAIVIFEGADRSGKSTLREMLREKRNHKDVTLDRFFGSMIVYGRLFGILTKNQIAKFECGENKFEKNFAPVLVLLTSSIAELDRRIWTTGHNRIGKRLIKKTLQEFDKYFDECPYKHRIKIDTSKLSEEKALDTLIYFLEKLETA